MWSSKKKTSKGTTWPDSTERRLHKVSAFPLVGLPVEVTLGTPWLCTNTEDPRPQPSYSRTSRGIVLLGGWCREGQLFRPAEVLIPNLLFALSYHLHFPFASKVVGAVFGGKLEEDPQSLAEATLVCD